MKITRNCLLSVCLLIFYPCIGQVEHHLSVWKDEYMLRYHMTEYLSGILIGEDFLTRPDYTESKYTSYLNDALSYLPAKGKTLKIEVQDFENVSIQSFDYYVGNPSSFSPAYLETLSGEGKSYEKTILQYDTLGRLTYVSRKTAPVPFYKEKSELKIRYENTGKVSGMTVDWKTTTFHSLAYFKGRKMKGKTLSKLEYVFDPVNLQKRAIESERYGIQRLRSSKDYTWTIGYSWDEKGRMTGKTENILEDSLTQKKTTRDYSEKTVDYEDLARHYPLLRVPSVEKRIKEKYAEKDLRFVDFTRDGKKESYLMYKTVVPVLKLDTQQYWLQHFYTAIEDSVGVSRSEFEISKLPDMNDTIPYDPDYRNIRSSIPNTVIINPVPHGLLSARSASLYRRSVTLLPEGWKMITYQRNYDVETRFAVNYPAWIRLDHIYSSYLFLDDKDVARYYFVYKKLYKMTEQS